MKKPPVYWRCFHCGAEFFKVQERWAREHFGRDESAKPVCLLRIPGEDGLIAALRKAEDELARFRAEDSDILRAMEQMSVAVSAADHRLAVQRAEEEGYAKGLRDANHQEAA